jgi:hypothetical protein
MTPEAPGREAPATMDQGRGHPVLGLDGALETGRRANAKHGLLVLILGIGAVAPLGANADRHAANVAPIYGVSRSPADSATAFLDWINAEGRS